MHVMELQCISVSRYYEAENFGRVVRTALHHFSDASVKGYGHYSYLRMIDEHD